MTIWIIVAAVCAFIIAWVLYDYQRYASRTNASAVWGWAVTRFLYTSTPHLDRKMIDPATALRLDPESPSFLDASRLPSRSEERPGMVRGIPHRQLDQHPDGDTRASFRKRLATMDDLTSIGAESLEFRPSLWELTEAEAFVVRLRGTKSDGSHLHRTKGEFAHLHSHDGSMHMMLSPADVSTVIRLGWGELFAIAGRLRGRIPPVALIYAPRDHSEAETVIEILRASYRYAMTFQD